MSTVLRHPSFAPHLQVVHGFSGKGPGGDDWDLTPSRDDADLAAAWSRVMGAVAPGTAVDALALVDQVHGDDVLVVDAPTGPCAAAGSADALVTTVPDLALAVRVADCVPVLLATPGGVAAVHSGWRGTAKGIVGRAIEILSDTAGCPTAAIHAVLGPHIRPEAYEVGPEVVEGLAATGCPEDLFVTPGRGDRSWVDVGAVVRWQLRQAGLVHVHDVGACTSAPGWWSHRHDGPGAGRQAGVVVRCSA